MTAPLVVAEGVTKRLAEGVTLVSDIDLSIEGGEFVAITGPSGSGKSSLLYLLGLLDRPSAGRVLLEGRDTAALGPADLAALRLARLGFVFQFHFLLPEFSALDNVLIPIRRRGALKPAAAASLTIHSSVFQPATGCMTLSTRMRIFTVRPKSLSAGRSAAPAKEMVSMAHNPHSRRTVYRMVRPPTSSE